MAQIKKEHLPFESGMVDSLAVKKEYELARKIRLLYPDSAMVLFKDIYLKSSRAGLKNGQINSLFNLGNLVMQKGQNAKAINYYRAGIRLCDTVLHKKILVDFHVNLGNAYNNLSQFESAYKTYVMAAVYAKGDSIRLPVIYGNASTVLGQLRQFKKALSYINRALDYLPISENQEMRAVLLMNKGRCYYELKDYPASSLFIDSAISIARKHGLHIELRAGLIEAARVDIARAKPTNAIPQLLEAIQLSKLPGMSVNKRNEAFSTIGDAYLQMKNYKEAEKYLLWVSQSPDLQDKEKLFIEGRLAVLYHEIGNYKKAFLTQQNYISLKDSLQNKEITISVNDLETKYRTSEKDKEITQNRLLISNQERLMAEKNSLLYGIAFIALLIISLLSARYAYIRQKNRRLESQQEIGYLKAVMEGEQAERVRIATELHDSIVSELTIVKMNLEVNMGAKADPDRHKNSMSQLKAAIDNVRNTAHNLMPEIVLRHNLPQAVELLCATIQKTGRLHIKYQSYGDFTQLNTQLRKSVYVIIQELLHNIIKHAKASHALVQLSCYDQLLTITIEDNGIGMNIQKKKHATGMGLANIADRVSKEKGRIEWTHNDLGEGTNVHMEFDV